MLSAQSTMAGPALTERRRRRSRSARQVSRIPTVAAMPHLTAGDWIQIGGLAVNAGLLTGLIVQIRLSARVRREDTRASKLRSTLDAWSALGLSIRAAEVHTRTYFGRDVLTDASVVRFLDQVETASRSRAEGGPQGPESAGQIRILEAHEALRTQLNSAEYFAVGVELGAYDLATAHRIAGWRLSVVVRRHLAYLNAMRHASGDEGIYRTLQDFAEGFLVARGLRLEDVTPLHAGRAGERRGVTGP